VEKYLSATDAALRLNRSLETIRNLCRLGLLHPKIDAQGEMKFTRKEIESVAKRLTGVIATPLSNKQAAHRAGPLPHLLLLLKDTPETRVTLPLFERFLSSNHLQIMRERDYPSEALREFVVAAASAADIKWASRLCHDLFREAIVALRASI
jgi:hypothetical protein